MSRYYQPSSILRTLLISASAAFLLGCGSGGGDGEPETPVGSASGTLTDAAVQGVSYSNTPSGITGVTNAQGEYRFNPGDVVTFRLGTLDLGTVTADFDGLVITPIALAAGNDDKLNNLLVLLQSLDADGDPSNGIVIPSTAATAVTSSIDLNADPADFASAATNPALQTAMTAGGITTPIRSVEAAQEHFKEQGIKLLSSQVWAFYDDDTAGFLRIAEDGSHIMGEASPDDYSGFDCIDGEPPVCTPSESAERIGTAGVEYGGAGNLQIVSVDSYGYKVVVNPSVDTNLQFGLSHPIACDRFQSLGEKLSASGNCPDADEGVIDKAPNNVSSIVGVWALNSATSLDTVHIMFLPNGKYLLSSIDDGDSDCSSPGVEFGSYSWNSATGALAISNVTYDTNGCAGLYEEGQSYSFTVTLANSGQLLNGTSSDDEEGFTLHRVSR